MISIITPKVNQLVAGDDTAYRFLLAVASDGLYILSPDKTTIIETIVDGKDTEGWMFQADDENAFLDAIICIKRDILDGYNPLDWLL